MKCFILLSYIQIVIGSQECVTTSGKPCVPQFKYKGVTYTGCTSAYNKDNRLWCSTRTDYYLNSQRWQYCEPSCKKECVTTSGKPCVPQFKYKGVTYKGCTSAYSKDKRLWCSTRTDYYLNSQRWQYCEPSCKKGNGKWGSWSSWGSWSACSATCGGGSRRRSRDRTCDNQDCVGDKIDEMTATCNTCNTCNNFCTDLSSESERLIKYLQNEDLDSAVEIFNDLPKDEKQQVILSPNVTPGQADKLLSNEDGDNIDVINQEIIEKINKACDHFCQKSKQDAISKTVEVEITMDKMFEKKEEELTDVIEKIELTSNILNELGNFVVNLNEQTVNPDEVRQHLIIKIENAKKLKMLSGEKAEAMKQKVIDATDFDPLWTTSFKEITDNTNRELRIRRSEELKKNAENKSKWKKAKNYWKATKNGIASSTSVQNIEKGFTAASHLGNAVGKFLAASESDSKTEKALKITSGVLDIANGISTFLPPPASVITGTVSSIFNMFGLGGGGGPSNQDVIDEVKRGFAKQRQFIGLEFSKQKIFIRDQFQKQHDLLTQNIASQLELQNVYIFGLFVKLQDSNSISRLEIARNEVIREIEDISIQALGLLDETSNKLIFVQSFDNDINDHVAEQIHDALNVLETKDDAKLRHFIEKKCLPELASCLNNDLKKTCIFMIETMMTIEKYREMTVTVLVNILQRTKLRELNKGYLQTEKSNKEALKTWMERILLDKRVGCLLLNLWQADQWTKDEQQINILNYITHTDLQMRKALDTFKSGKKKEYCRQLNQGVWSGTTCEDRVVDGHWGSWGSWGSCQSTCTMDKQRRCNNPPPKNGGKSCLGHKLETKCCKGGLCPPEGCPNGWKHDSDPSIYYKVFRQKLKWSDARNYCHQQKGELASVSSSTNRYLGLMAEGPAWIGGYRTGNTWKWTDGSAWRFTSWESGEPNNYQGKQDKALINWKGIGIWDDQENDRRHAFICQRKPQKYECKIYTEECVSYFEFKGVGYKGCTSAHNNGELWCSVYYSQGWAFCKPSYKKVCKTTSGKPCAPLFKYKGVTYKGCTSAYSKDKRLWCSTRTDGHLNSQTWDHCASCE